jgi:hypothetical protein
MGVDVAADSQGLTVQAASFLHGKGAVYYTSTTCADQTLNGSGTDGTGDKQRLVSTLWDHLVSMENLHWKHCQSSNRAGVPIQVVSGLLGKPHLLLGKERGPAITFSACGGNVWAALCGDGSDIGIDVAGADEFQSDYPYLRVFHPEELEHALKLTGGVLDMASALLWSIKEAVVKALGCAFHLVDPLQITVHPLVESSGGGFTFPVGLSGKALVRFPLAGGRSLRVRSVPQDSLWLSIALVTRRPTGHE